MKKIFAIAVILICISLLASATLAYFTDQATVRNVITTGAVQITVLDQQILDGKTTNSSGIHIPIMPGSTVSKIIAVQCDEAAAYVRMAFRLSVLDADGTQMTLSADDLKQIIAISPNAEHWTLQDGWWYYNSAIQSGEITTPLFEQVAFSGPDMGNQYQLCTVVIDVTAQAVQAANNGNDPLQASGWPET